MDQTENRYDVSLPEGLRGQFAELEHRLWRIETCVAIGLALTGLLGSYLLLFLSDRLWDTPVWLRSLLALGGALALLGPGWRWSRLWLWQRRDQKALADLVQKKYRRLGDRLLGIVELADEKQRPPNFSPELYRAAIHQVAAEAIQYDFRQAISPQGAKARGWTLLGIFVPTLLIWLVLPVAGWNSFRRWAAPTAAIARYTLVDLAGLPRQQIVPHGEPFQVKCAVQYRSFWHPGRASAQYAKQPWIESPVSGEQVHLRIPGQVQRGVLKIRVGDARRELFVFPMHRPSLKQIAAEVELPDYLQYPLQHQIVQNGSLPVLEGSRVTFQGKISRKLTEAQISMDGQGPHSMEVEGETFSSEPLDLKGVSQCAFSWRDFLTLSNAAPWRLAIQTQADLPPVPELPGLASDLAILEKEVLELKTVAEDDYGVRELGLWWQLSTASAQTNAPLQQEFKVQGDSPQARKLEKTFRFSPALLRIPPDSTIELRAQATDFYPGREPAQSSVYRIHVLGNEKHADLIRQRLESLLVRLEEVTRLEEKIAAATGELKDQDKLAEAEATERIGEVKEDQSQNARSLDEVAREGMKTLREALRNPIFTEQALRDWAKQLQEMEQLAQGEMQQAAASLQSAQQNPDSRSQKMAEAQTKEEEILKALEQMQQQVNQGLDQLQALTLAERLRKLAKEEKKLEAQLQKTVPETIGILPKELPPKFQQANAVLATGQTKAQKESQVLQGEISRFFERTQLENYGQVSREMTAAGPADELEKIRGLIQENIAMEAMQNLASWSERFEGWAAKLQPKPDASAAGGGGGGGGGANQVLLQLLALLRLREGEVNLQQQTELAEQQKSDEPVYRENAEMLSAAQNSLLVDLHEVQRDGALKPLQEPLQEINEAMQEVASFLRKPQTDEPAVQAETKTIERLSDVINLINEESQNADSQPSSQSSSSEEMAFVMEMMAPEPGPGMSMSPTGGGSMAGGNATRPASPLTDDPQGKRAEARGVLKASGLIYTFPIEFRDALKNYFDAIEEVNSSSK
ncbi:MAG: hypothetical protein AAB466_03370 [Verrucomicrobiota bacterium]